jgi:MscS family membrane protein
MELLREFTPPIFREWVEAIVVIVITLFAVATFRTVVARLKNHPGWHLAWELGSYISNLGYVIGIRLFVQVAPIDPRSKLYLDDAAYVLTVFVFLMTARKAAVFALVKKTGRSANSSETLHQGFIPLVRNLMTLFIFISGAIMVLKHFNYDVLSLLTALGVGSLAIGLAAKETLANMISGFMLIIDRNLRPGDRINFKGDTGDVLEIGLRSTRILSGAGNEMIVPNFDLVNNTIVNLSEPSRASICTTQIRVPYAADFKNVQALCLKLLGQTPKVDQARGKWVNLTSLSEGYQLISIGCWMKEMDDAGDVLTVFNQALLTELHAQNIHLVESSALVAGLQQK